MTQTEEFNLSEKIQSIEEDFDFIRTNDVREFIRLDLDGFRRLAESILTCPDHSFTKEQIRAKILNQILISEKFAGIRLNGKYY